MTPKPVLGLCRSNNATISAPTKGTVTKNSIVVTGTVEWYKDGATWGVAYKKHSASSWTHKASTSKSINETLSSLTASTQYDIKLYVLFDGVYQYGSEINVTTSAAE
jgi:hypothetical protein